MGWYYFPKASPMPKAVEGKHRKKFGLTWWGRKWIEAVECEGTEQRMARGRAYARADRVFGMDVRPGVVKAKVEGSLGDYVVKINVEKFSEKQWAGIIERIRESPALGVVLNNQLPEDIEEVCGVDLIPSDLEADCSCPDWENPCKHIAAAYYVLADEIDKAPAILFKLRGIEKNDLLAGLQGIRLQKPLVVKKVLRTPTKPGKGVAKGKSRKASKKKGKR